MHARSTWFAAVTLLLLAACSELDSPTAPTLEPRFSDTPNPMKVIITGSLQSELGCAGDWDPACPTTELNYDPDDRVWQGYFDVPAGGWEYKAALNWSWDEHYGLNATRNGPNIPLTLANPAAVKFYYDHETHWVTTNQTVIAVAPGSFQSELGCPGDWQPDCLRSWLKDPDGDGTYTFTTHLLPAGDYEVKVAINESWSENYGAGGAQNGANIAFSVPAFGVDMLFSYVDATHVLTVTEAPPPVLPSAVVVLGSFQAEVGCSDDWQPACSASALERDLGDDVYQATFSIPAGAYEYKVALDNSWDENYGANATRNGTNIPLNVSESGDVKFYYHPVTHWVTSDRNTVIAVAAGSFQSELGCPGDWQPDCLRSWLMDPDGDGTYAFTTDRLAAGNYEVKVTISESWDENYGAGGVRNADNIAFTVLSDGDVVVFTYDPTTHVLTVTREYSDDAPVVITTVPVADATDVARGAALGVTFSEEVNVADPWFHLSCGSSEQSFKYSGGPTSFTIDPDADLPPAASCTATVISGGVTDEDVNDPPDGISQYSWSFTTAPLTVAERFEAVDALIVAVVADAGVEKNLRARLAAAYAYWEAGQTMKACNALEALVKTLPGLTKKKLDASAAAQIQTAVTELQAALGC